MQEGRLRKGQSAEDLARGRALCVMGHAAQPLRHQGQAPEYSAVLRVSRDLALARSLLQPLPQQTESHHLGSLSEVVDGNPPFTPRGCIAQVRSVAEARRVREEIGRCLQVPI